MIVLPQSSVTNSKIQAICHLTEGSRLTRILEMKKTVLRKISR